jgi:O-antigen/teichoic acid export membrane protein
MIGLFDLLNYLNTRLGTFKEVAQVRILRSVATSTIQLTAGFFSSGIHGLLSGSAVGNLVGNTKLFRTVNERYDLLRGYNTKEAVRLGKKYSDFPKITTFSELVNTFQQNISSVIIPILFSTGVLGYYSLAQRILGVPTSLVGDSIRQVFLRAATTARQVRGEALKEFDMAVKSLAFMAIPAFTLLFFIVVPVFSLIFGKEWEEAGVYARILIPYFAVTFISANMSTVMIVFEKQRQMMNIKLAQLVLLATLYGFVKYTGVGIKEYLTLFCIMSSMGNLVFLMYFRNVSKGKQV